MPKPVISEEHSRRGEIQTLDELDRQLERQGAIGTASRPIADALHKARPVCLPRFRESPSKAGMPSLKARIPGARESSKCQRERFTFTTPRQLTERSRNRLRRGLLAVTPGRAGIANQGRLYVPQTERPIHHQARPTHARGCTGRNRPIKPRGVRKPGGHPRG